MPLTITYDQWMKDTSSLIHPRSGSLKLIDNAIKARNEAETKKALINWIDEQNRKKQDWQRSVRNEKGAVKALYDQLGVLSSPQFFKNFDAMMADKQAKDFIKQEQQLAAAKLFTGGSLKFKDSFWGICRQKSADEKQKINVAKTALGVAGKGAVLGKDLGMLARDLNILINAIIKPLPPEPFRSEIVEAVLGSSAEEFVGNIVPFLGMALSGGKAVKAWIAVAQNSYDAEQMFDRRGDIRLGDPSAALYAIRMIIDRNLLSQKLQAGVRTGAFTAKGLFTLADFGTASTSAVGAAESIAILLNMLAEVVRDALEIRAGNKLIADKNIDLNVFLSCPVLGCYYIAMQDHSTIMNFDVANMGRENWQQEAERLKYAVKPVIEKARELIAASRIELQGMDNAKGVYQSTLMQKIEMYFKSQGKGLSNNMDSIKGLYQG